MRRNIIVIGAFTLVTSVLAFSGALATSKSKALKDFESQYKPAEGRKRVSLTYVGKPRSFMQAEGLVQVPYKAYQVKLVDLFEACGLKVEYTWEVWYRKNKTFTQIAILDHKFLNSPPPPAPLPDAKVLELLGNGWEKGSNHYTTKVQSISVTKQTPGWNFCNPRYELEFTVNLTSGKSHEPMHDVYECKAAALINKKGEEFEVNTNDCFDPKTGKKTQCYYANHCKHLGQKSVIAPLAWGDLAKKVLSKGVCESAKGDTRTGCAVAEMKMLSEGAPSADNKKKTFKLQYVLTFTEHNMGRKDRSDPWKITSKYRCHAQAEVEWNDAYADLWTTSDLKYCKDASSACDKEPTVTLHRVCECLEPAGHCAGLKSND